jgi:hypothetical protein
MEIKQSRNSNRIRYVFGEDELQYSLEDTSGSRSFSVAYTDISRDRQTLVERNQWLGNVGLLWLALGAVLTIVSFVGGKGTFSFWLWIGGGCYAVYRLRTTRFTIVPSEKGNLLVIDDEEGKRILSEIESRRAAQFKAEYDFMPEGDTPEQLRGRFKWLHREGALTDDELRARLAAIDAADAVRTPEVASSLRAMLN